MKDIPCVVSIGKKCMKQKCAFIWLDGLVPCMVLPDVQIVLFDVIGDVAYFLEEGVHTTCRNPNALAALCGIWVLDGGIVLSVTQCFAAALAGSSSDIAVVAGIPKADEDAELGEPAEKDPEVATKYFRVHKSEQDDEADADSTGIPSEGAGVNPDSTDDEAPARS
jgi:hypothetical protein